MIFYLYGESKPYISTIDIEYDNGIIIQIAAIMLKNVGPHIYQVCRSINLYINQGPISRFIQEYTHITQDFMREYGVSIDEALDLWHMFLKDIDINDLKFVSHGIHQDALCLAKNGFDIDEYEHQCTYVLARHVLDRTSKLRVSDIAAESGLAIFNEHNAYADALATLGIYAYLLKLQGEQ